VPCTALWTALWSDDLDAYAAGETGIAQINCAICVCAPCRCPEFGTASYLAMLDVRHGRAASRDE
jgi:hypothetical protein